MPQVLHLGQQLLPDLLRILLHRSMCSPIICCSSFRTYTNTRVPVVSVVGPRCGPASTPSSMESAIALLNLIVLKKDGCSVDLQLVAAPESWRSVERTSTRSFMASRFLVSANGRRCRCPIAPRRR